MSLTLVEGAKYSNDVLQRGVIEELVKGDPLLERMQFVDIVGNGLTYNTESTLSGADFYAVGDTWAESTSVVAQKTAVSRILGGDADVDSFLKATRSNVQDLMAEQITAKTKAIRRKFLDMAIYGDIDTDTKGFDGLHSLMTSLTLNTVTVATSSGTPVALPLLSAEEAKDLIKNGDAEVVMMTKKMRREINQYLNGVGGITKMDIQGSTVQTLFDVPVVVSDHLSDDEACDKDYGTNQFGHNDADGVGLGDDDNATSIFFLQFAPKAFTGVQTQPVTTERFSKLETKDAARVRIKWYVSVMLQSLISCSKVTGIDPAATVTA
ncbi:hypothetical protein CMI37_15200 [Candidatus Pacearchaeota archaeon]|mgnify:CR=1 FL=1|nr:hypothetical protein [Candidatus Pacearchaeota archaeon]|tara:strand:+ start:2804 stop:3772 length:969 start_codon:yes stop_codon:yes gene_type:complete